MAIVHFKSGKTECWVIECDVCGQWASEGNTGGDASFLAVRDGFSEYEKRDEVGEIVDIVDHCRTCTLASVPPGDSPQSMSAQRRRNFDFYSNRRIRDPHTGVTRILPKPTPARASGER